MIKYVEKKLDEELDKNLGQNIDDDAEEKEDKKGPKPDKNDKEPQEEEKYNYEDKIKNKVKGILKRKIKESGYWAEEQLEGAKNTMESQTDLTSDYILSMARRRVPGSPEPGKEKVYIRKFKKEAVNIAEYETMVNPNFDIETAIKREAEINEKLENGEISPEEAFRALAKPIPDLKGNTIDQIRKTFTKDYDEMYQEVMARRNVKGIRKNNFRESLTKGVPSLEEQARHLKDVRDNPDRTSGSKSDRPVGREVGD